MNITRRVIYILSLVFATSFVSNAQIAINSDGSSPDGSAMLDVTSVDKGILVPRMTTIERTAISSPATGLLVYDTDENSFWYYNNTEWITINTDSQTLTYESDTLTISDGNSIDLSDLRKLEDSGLIITGGPVETSTVDVSQTSHNYDFTTMDTWQSFKPTVSGYLSKVEIKFHSPDFDGGHFRVYDGQGTGGTLLLEISIGSITGYEWQSIDLSDEYFSVTSGQEYTIYLIDTLDNSFTCYGTYLTNDYYVDGRAAYDSNADLAFKTYYDETSTKDYTVLGLNNINTSNLGLNLSYIDTLYFNDGTIQTSSSYNTNQNIELNDNWISNDGGDEGISITNNGNVTLSGKLTVGNDYTFPSSDGDFNEVLLTDGSGTLSWSSINQDLGDHTATQNIELDGNWISNDGGNEGITIDDDGNVGIGVAATNAILEIDGTGPSSHTLSSIGYLNTGGSGTGSYNGTFAVYANGRIGATAFIAHSDERIKNIQGVSNSKNDLNTLMNIEITDYTLKDTVTNGNDVTKKVIAQQVKSVYPRAVSTNTIQVVPDIYQTAAIDQNGWVNLTTDLKIGEKVQIIFNDKKETLEVVATKENAFRIKQPATRNSKPTTVFIYGRQVNDFHTVDYEAISMLNVSATQQLAKENKALKERMVKIEKENIELKAQVEKINQLEAKLEAFLNQ